MEAENEPNIDNLSDSSSSSSDSWRSTVTSSEFDLEVELYRTKIEEIFPDFMTFVAYELGANTSDYFVFAQFVNDYQKRNNLCRVNPMVMRIFQEHPELAFQFLRFLPKGYKIPDPPQNDIDGLLTFVDFTEKLKIKCEPDERSGVLVNILKDFMAHGKCSVKLVDEMKELFKYNPDVREEIRLFFDKAGDIKWQR